MRGSGSNSKVQSPVSPKTPSMSLREEKIIEDYFQLLSDFNFDQARELTVSFVFCFIFIFISFLKKNSYFHLCCTFWIYSLFWFASRKISSLWASWEDVALQLKGLIAHIFSPELVFKIKIHNTCRHSSTIYII